MRISYRPTLSLLLLILSISKLNSFTPTATQISAARATSEKIQPSVDFSTISHNTARTSLYYKVQSDGDDDPKNNDISPQHQLPEFIQSIVLKQVYPSLVKHCNDYGNPNIPLGTKDGKKCKTLRRLAFQNKLTPEEVQLLADMGFRFNSLEDVYEEADFDECLNRLLDYESEFQTKYQIPKKYKPDPELGAWVTMIRRIGKDNIDPIQREKLDAIGFAWVSTRKCGSSFMKNYRSIKERVEACCSMHHEDIDKSEHKLQSGDEDRITSADGIMVVVNQEELGRVLDDAKVVKWLRAQNEARLKGNLSETRCEFLDQLPGFNWREI